jgi:predicted nucleic acid-binding protein
MSKKPKAIVLDSWAVVAYLEDEPSSEKVADIMADAHEQKIPLLMTVVNAGEVWYIIARQTSDADADRSIKQLRDLGIEFVDADWNLAHDAGYFKSRNKMSFADAFAAALARQRKAHLVTGDPEFKQVEKEVVVSWL